MRGSRVGILMIVFCLHFCVAGAVENQIAYLRRQYQLLLVSLM